ncbi:MAG: ABC transporter permease [Verrucomicrobia bacterium]|nr:ABC transporter permease [Verrucomicrobiota bacterium]
MITKIKASAASIGEFTLMIAQMIWASLRKPPSWKLVRNQFFDIGVLSLPVVAITGLSTGMVLAAQAYFQLSDKGLTGTTGVMVAKSMIVELGPILTAFMITGRVGASITAELGSMRVTEQIDALQSMAVNPLQYLIAPRFLAMTAMVPILTIFSCAMGILGGYLIAVHVYGMAPLAFFDPMPAFITWFDLFSGLSKSLIFGLLIVTISCYRGINTKGGAAGVGKSTTNSVVICYSAILIANFILTLGLNASYWLIFT